MSPQMIAYYHTGDRTPTFTTLEKIAEYLQCNALELLTPPEGFAHFYDEQWRWLGIVRKYPYQDKEADVLQQNEQYKSKEQQKRRSKTSFVFIYLLLILIIRLPVC